MSERVHDISAVKFPPETGNYDSFWSLYTRTEIQVKQDHQNRVLANNTPTKAEYTLGTFAEDIPAFMRSAVFRIHRKGYMLNEWGITGFNKNIQFLSGEFVIENQKTRSALSDMNVTLDISHFDGVKSTEIYFKPETPNIHAIKKKWDRIADIMPDLGCGMRSRRSSTATSFRYTYPRDKEKASQWPDNYF